jgi:hypothetical protein
LDRGAGNRDRVEHPNKSVHTLKILSFRAGICDALPAAGFGLDIGLLFRY